MIQCNCFTHTSHNKYDLKHSKIKYNMSLLRWCPYKSRVQWNKLWSQCINITITVTYKTLIHTGSEAFVFRRHLVKTSSYVLFHRFCYQCSQPTIGVNLAKIYGGGLQNESGGLGDSPPVGDTVPQWGHSPPVGSRGKGPAGGLGDSPPEAEAFL